MICIYIIRSTIDGKVYVGKTADFASRVRSHKYNMLNFYKTSSNRHLYNACQKYGIDNFEFCPIEIFDILDEEKLSERELFWMLHYKSCDRKYGYNLRMDSSTKCIVHEETRAIYRTQRKGRDNANYGNKWTERMREKMSKDALARHAAGRYDDEWKKKISESSRRLWKDEDKKQGMAEKVRMKKRKYDFIQKDKDGNEIRVWESVRDIISENPSYKWQNIYSVCNGYKKSYMGYVWEKVLKRTP